MNNQINKAMFFLAVSFFLLTAQSAHAICPVCTVAVGAGVGFSRYLGVDDTISGLWIGALTVSMIMWTVDYFNRKNWRFKGKEIIITLAYYALIVAPLYWTGIMGHALNTIAGVDKILFGVILGSIFFFSGGMLHFHLKAKNGDKVYFPFQKVVFAVSPVVVLSFVFYFITR